MFLPLIYGTSTILWQADELPMYPGGKDRMCPYVKISYQNKELTLYLISVVFISL